MGDAMMVSGNRLQGLSWPLLVEVVYLAGRYLRHGLTWDAFQRQLEADVQIPNRQRAVAIVRAVINDIETAEQTEIGSLSLEKRQTYLSSLNALLMEKTRASAVSDDVEDALAELRAVP